jgi:hypothetical protein
MFLIRPKRVSHIHGYIICTFTCMSASGYSESTKVQSLSSKETGIGVNAADVLGIIYRLQRSTVLTFTNLNEYLL